MLKQLGIVDADGVLQAGTRVTGPDGEVTADGSDEYVISASGSSPQFAGRLSLIPSDDGPAVIYLDSYQSDGGSALIEGIVDAIAEDVVGTQVTAQRSGGQLVVVGLDPAIERGGFALAVGDPRIDCLNDRIGWLTDHGRIEYNEWLADDQVFARRASTWNRQ